jgi:hypothetical protein
MGCGSKVSPLSSEALGWMPAGMIHGPFIFQVFCIAILLGLAGYGHWLCGVLLSQFRR